MFHSTVCLEALCHCVYTISLPGSDKVVVSVITFHDTV